jgi:hypothetical protein
MWMPAILKFAQQAGWGVVPIIKSACSPPLWTTGSGECRAWLRWAVRAGSALHPDLTLIAGHYTYRSSIPDRPSYDQALTAGLNLAISGLQKQSKRVVVVGDIPDRARQPVDCLLAPHATLSGCSDTPTPSEPNLTSVAAQVAQFDHVGFIDTTGWVCSQGQCPLVVGNLITYRDTDHVSQTYSTALSGAFRAALNVGVKPAGRL